MIIRYIIAGFFLTLSLANSLVCRVEWYHRRPLDAFLSFSLACLCAWCGVDSLPPVR